MSYMKKEMLLPKGSTKLSVEEMRNVEGGLTVEAICAMIGAAAVVEGGIYQVGRRVAKTISSNEYDDIKWPLRVAVCAMCTPIIGAIHMTNFENGFYDYKNEQK